MWILQSWLADPPGAALIILVYPGLEKFMLCSLLSLNSPKQGYIV